MTKEGFCWKTWGKKVLFQAAAAGASGLLAYAQQDQRYLVLVPVLEGLRNMFKHRAKLLGK